MLVYLRSATLLALARVTVTVADLGAPAYLALAVCMYVFIVCVYMCVNVCMYLCICVHIKACNALR